MLTKSVSDSRSHPSSLLRREVARRLDPLHARPIAGPAPIPVTAIVAVQPAPAPRQAGPTSDNVIDLPRARTEEPLPVPAAPRLPLGPLLMVATGALLSVAWSGWLLWSAAKAAITLF